MPDLEGSMGADRGIVAGEREVIGMEHNWVDAALQGDGDAFAAFMADEYVAVLPDARIRGKAEWVDSVRSGGVRYESVDLRNLSVRLYGDTAVVAGEFAQKATSGGHERTEQGTFVTTWLKRGQRWQAIASGFSTTTR